MSAEEIKSVIEALSQEAYRSVRCRGKISDNIRKFAVVDLQLEAIECEINEVRQEIFACPIRESKVTGAKAFEEECADVFIAVCTLLKVAGVKPQTVIDKMLFNKTREERNF